MTTAPNREWDTIEFSARSSGDCYYIHIEFTARPSGDFYSLHAVGALELDEAGR